jgi:hypothetical protein
MASQRKQVDVKRTNARMEMNDARMLQTLVERFRAAQDADEIKRLGGSMIFGGSDRAGLNK